MGFALLLALGALCDGARPRVTLHFVTLQDPRVQALARRLGIDPGFAETNAVIVGGRAYFKTDAAIEVLSRLPHWSWVRVCRAVHRIVRDGLYDMIACNRYRPLGRSKACVLPMPELMRRVLGRGAQQD